MGKYFDKCENIQELSRERSRLLAEINAEFTVRSKELSTVTRTFKNVPVYNITEYKRDKEAFASFNIQEGGLSHEIVVDLNESTVLI